MIRFPRVLVLLVLGTAAQVQAQQGSITGRVEDARTRQPVVAAALHVVGTTLAAESDERGVFRIDSVPAGRHEVRVRHLAYGDLSVQVTVEAGRASAVRLVVSGRVVTLEPIPVDVLSTEERANRGAGYRQGVVTRAQLAEAEAMQLTMAEVLRHFVPGVTVRRLDGIVGSAICLELRTIRATFGNQCLSPAVFLDGVPVQNPVTLYNSFSIRMIERMTVVPAAEAGVRYGTGALYGALLIETRNPAGEAQRAAPVQGPMYFDWSQDGATHPSLRSFAFATLGSGAGLYLGLAAANQCIGTRAPSHDRLIAKCDGWTTAGAAVAALVLPSIGSALGAGMGGRTEMSRGQPLPAVIGGAMGVIPAYSFILSAKRMDSDMLSGIGYALLVIGVPAVSTFADHQFRKLRGLPEPAR